MLNLSVIPKVLLDKHHYGNVNCIYQKCYHSGFPLRKDALAKTVFLIVNLHVQKYM